jgi:hypothetical protein
MRPAADNDGLELVDGQERRDHGSRDEDHAKDRR